MKGNGILIDNNYELMIQPVRDADGKIITGMLAGNTLYQNQALILSFHPGTIKSAPLVGVGISNALLGFDFLGWRRKIKQQMELDGQLVNKVTFSNTESLSIDATYR